MIPNEFIDELLNKVDIVDIIDEFVPLKKRGTNYMACCPFHKEKSASFSVSPTKQFYHCFGCGAHGSAISFIMEYQGLNFIETVQFLADRIGMTVPKQNRHDDLTQAQNKAYKQQQQTLTQTITMATDFYRQQLNLSTTAQNYLQQRGLSHEIIAHYDLGYVPDNWQALAQVFQPYPTQALINSGMVIEKEEKCYDRFRDRIMFPIHDIRGQVIAFGGRIIGSGEPKYLNSPETPLFDKGRQLYGLYQARSAIKQANRVLVVEGYMDVVALAQFGIGYAVAALGTATTVDHIRLLMRQSNNIYFCFDGDQAGQKAAWRALVNALPELKDDKTLHFLFLPTEHDPDSFVRTQGAAVFEDVLLHQSLPLSQYFWQTLTATINLTTQEGKAELIKNASQFLNQIKAPALSFLLRQELSEKVGIDDYNLAQLMGQETPSRIIRQKDYHLPTQTFRQPPMMTLVQKQIRALLINPQWAVYIDLPEYLDLHGDYACLVALAECIQASTTPLNCGAVLELMRNTEFEPIIQHIMRHYLDSPESISANDNEEDRMTFKQGMQKLLDSLKSQQIDTLKRKLQNQVLSADEKQLLLRLLSPS